MNQTIEQINELSNKVCYEVLEKLSQLGVDKFEFEEYRVNYGMDILDHSKSLYVKNVYYKQHWADPECCRCDLALHVTLSNDKVINLLDIPLLKLNTIRLILTELDYALYDKNNSEQDNRKTIHIENKDIIITDPCYIVKKPKQREKTEYISFPYDSGKKFAKENGWDIDNLTLEQFLQANKQYMKATAEYYEAVEKQYEDDDWEKTDCGNDVSVLGLTKYLTSSTLYGDWSCTTFDDDTSKEIGRFCADAGLVGVFELDEVLKYNPDFDYHITKPWTTTLIKNFTGDVWVAKDTISGVYEEDTKYHKKGETWSEDVIRVYGKGNVNFHTEQTGF